MEPDDAPVLRMHQKPQVEHLPNGQWRASYAGLNWSVTATTRAAAVAELQAEDQRRVESDPAYRDLLFDLARRTLADPVPGIESEEITRGEYWYRSGGRDRLTLRRDEVD